MAAVVQLTALRVEAVVVPLAMSVIEIAHDMVTGTSCDLLPDVLVAVSVGVTEIEHVLPPGAPEVGDYRLRRPTQDPELRRPNH